MAKSSTCYSLTCGRVVAGTVETCPSCGKRMNSSAKVRTLGGVLLLLGLFIAGLIGAIAIDLVPMMLHPGETIEGGRFSGMHEQAKLFLALFGLVFAFGAIATVIGLWQLVTGRRPRPLIFVVLGFAVILYGYALYLVQTMP